ncbi:MAG TPA: N-acetylneuraminate synthase family protein [Bacteroidia bacterium]|jgi:N,N'-diacetyllegionaminate synthase|nr:N-acetylneuraminate synthase family protein [Bacteroidia bacterium]
MKKSYVISEIGNNHNGSLEKALALIDVSKEANVDAVKFQTFRGIDIVSPKVLANEYKGWDVKNFEFWYQFLDTIALKLEDHQKAIDYTLKKGMDFITTPTSPFIVEYLEKLKGIKAYKIASMDLNNTPLLEAVAKTKKEIIMSTGMGEMDEVKKAVDIFKNHKLSVLHCVSDYPLDPEKAFLNNITSLKKQFPNLDIGFSDHSLGHELCIAARCLGAVVFEKHITLDRKDPNPAEHHFSMEPNEFRELVNWIRHIDANLNAEGFLRSETEKVNKLKYRRSYHYNANFSRGEKMSLDKLSFVRPGDGIDNDELNNFIGKALNKNVKAYDPCNLNDIK